MSTGASPTWRRVTCGCSSTATTTASSISTPSTPSGTRRVPTASPTPGCRSRARASAVTPWARGSRTSPTASISPTPSIRRMRIRERWASTTHWWASPVLTGSTRRIDSEPQRERQRRSMARDACRAAASGLLGQYAHVQALLGAFFLELHLAGHLGEQRMVAADPDVRAGTDGRAALTHQDVPGEHLFAAEALDPQAFGVRVAAVLGTAACLFVCHDLRCPAKQRRSEERRVGNECRSGGW